jgi:hypothetical protein
MNKKLDESREHTHETFELAERGKPIFKIIVKI